MWEERTSYFITDPQRVSQAKGVLLALFPHVHMLVDAISHLPGDSEVVLSLAAGPDDQVSLVQCLHHLLCLVEADIVEVWVGDHSLDVRCRREWTRRGPVRVCLGRMNRKYIETGTLQY